MIDLDALLTPPTPTAAAALDVARRWQSDGLTNHCLRSWAWATTLAESIGLDYDAELLFVAAMLHDTGVAPHFDSHEVPFEDAGGAVGWTFAAGAGWPEARRQRVYEVIQRHAWPSVEMSFDPEGYLLEVATTLDVRGGAPERWDASVLRAVVGRVPRLDFGDTFDASLAAQAARKPGSNAARTHGAQSVVLGRAFWADFLR